jgi:hypothetical protein
MIRTGGAVRNGSIGKSALLKSLRNYAGEGEIGQPAQTLTSLYVTPFLIRNICIRARNGPTVATGMLVSSRAEGLRCFHCNIDSLARVGTWKLLTNSFRSPFLHNIL